MVNGQGCHIRDICPLSALDVKTRLTAVLLSTLAVVAAGCASQSTSDEELSANSPCPRNTTLKCFERASAPDECFCADRGNIENTIETIMRRGPN